MPETPPREQVTSEELNNAARLPLEELVKFMADRGLLGGSQLREMDDNEIKRLEKIAKLSPDCQSETG
ncbi:MAG: hypothetical protein ACFFB3_04715 [Candidatus Hodarchaeota archaeon]